MRALFCFFPSYFDIMKIWNYIKQPIPYIRLKYHVVWISRYQSMILVTGIKSYVKIKLQEIRKYYPDWEYIEIRKRMIIFICLWLPLPKYAVSKVVEPSKRIPADPQAGSLLSWKKYIGTEKVFGEKSISYQP